QGGRPSVSLRGDRMLSARVFFAVVCLEDIVATAGRGVETDTPLGDGSRQYRNPAFPHDRRESTTGGVVKSGKPVDHPLAVSTEGHAFEDRSERGNALAGRSEAASRRDFHGR